MTKLTTEQFIEKARKIHGDKYDYSKVEYIDSRTKVCIICPTHGEFWQRPNDHLNGKGCRKCVNNKPLTQTIFIDRAKKVHGGKYDYSKVNYINANTKVCIICPIHGEFWQKPYDHLIKKGCPKCASKNVTLDEFVRRARLIHGDKYDYSKTNFINMGTKVSIICPIHGEFLQTPTTHLQGYGCRKCGIESMREKQKLTTEDFIKRAKVVHGEKYDYSKVNYINNSTKICIICPIHGEFYQAPYEHLSGKGCRKCGYESVSKIKGVPFNEFVKRANKIHNSKYIYDANSYKNCSYKTKIICPQHGEFWQTPDHHLHGNGCPLCGESKLEREIFNFFTSKELCFERQKRFGWLGRQSLDFYVPEYNIGIECQGRQHFETIKHFGGTDELKKCKERDERKRKLCEEHGIKLLYFSDKKYSDEIITDKEKLLEIVRGK